MTVYIIVNDHAEKYVGISSNVLRRLKEHRTGKCKTTSKFKDLDFKHVHMWRLLTYLQASKLERWLHKRWRMLKGIVELHPTYDAFLRQDSGKLSTTPLERYMNQCGLCGRDVSTCSCDFGV